MGTILIILVALLVFGLLVVFHEFGHFGVAKLVGIKVHEFAIGMGTRILKVKGKETEYSIRILPIGGYVKMEGEDEHSKDERSFNNKPIWARILVIVAGPVMNFVLAIFLFTMMFYMMGFPTNRPIVGEIIPDFPAQIAGIEAGDEIISISGKEMDTWEKIVETIHENKDKDLRIKIRRDGEEKNFSIKSRVNEGTKQFMIGISPTLEKSFIKSFTNSFSKTIDVIKEMIGFFGKLFSGSASAKDVVGPVGIIYLVGEAAKTNIYYVLHLAGLISVNLGVVNLLPIPALDGGRLVFLMIEGLTGKPLDPEKEGFVHFTGFVLLMGLMLFMVYKDIVRFNLF
ncbi:RIP metalloprotease RseP [Marinisporobacter balticus]|uniref:Zinc metalloprotease n=1 Tax=Marinisporobacter balticus TaxID=2018667 RepID=A0A4R2L3V1_9FIRM|nr:RIP metalloprotease RseP [Marinisporobacter balticus]TCO79907.1 regulator of sigma E protease [Marinisporobacter balticus]